ncbi:MAG: nucleotidyltransferase family protein [Candidatus Omnitrophota bacterium]
MKALILAAGYATRLYPLTSNRPKPLLKIGGIPIIDHIVEKIARVKEIKEIIIISNGKFFNHFKKWAKNSYFKKRLSVINDKSTCAEDRLGAIGDIKYVLNRKQLTDDILVVGGDNLFTFELSDFVKFAHAKRPASCVGLYDLRVCTSTRRYGTVKINRKYRIVNFAEKNKHPVSTLVSMCLYYLTQQTLLRIDEYLKGGNNSDAPGYFISWLYKQEPVWGCVLNGEWYDIGDIISFYHANVTYPLK